MLNIDSDDDRAWKPQNMRLINREDCDEKGVCYTESKQTWVTLHSHLSERDIIDTSIEESLHQCMDMCGMTLIANNEQEEWFVEKLFWVMRGWILTDDEITPQKIKNKPQEELE